MSRRAAFVLAILVAAPAAHADAVARASFSRRRIMATEQVYYSITLSAERLPRSTATPQPDFSDFEVLDGPALSSSKQVSIVNGEVSQSEIHTYTWLLVPKKEGQLSVPPVAVDAGGTTVSTGREVIEVVSSTSALAPPTGQVPGGGGGFPQPPPPQPRRPQAQAQPSQPWQQNAPRLDVVASADDTDAWLGQEIVLSHVLRFDVNVETFSPKSAPDFPGFANTPFQLERPEGKPVRDPATGAVLYYEALIGRWSLVPLATGTQEIPPLAYVLSIQESPFQSIFGGFGGLTHQVTAGTQPLKINVRPLPGGAPASFGGAVGSFRMTGQLDATTVKEGEGVNLELKIDGTGSFRGVKAPKLTMPDGLKAFDPDVNEKAGLDPNARSEGTKTFRYPILANRAGAQEIPAVEWTFFDPSSARYVTRQVGPFPLTVTPGAQPAAILPPSAPVAAGVEEKGTDIRHIPASLGNWHPDLGGRPLPRWTWLAVLAGPVINLLLLAGGLARRARTSDPAALRERGAARRANARLKEARAALHAKQGVAAADAVARAVSGIVSDRLQLGAQIAPGEAAAALVQAGAPQLAADVERLLNDCDVARFATGVAGVNPVELVRRGEQLASKLLSARLARPEAAA